jgi:hypothetical protein
MTTDAESKQWYVSAVKIRPVTPSTHVLARAISFAVLFFAFGEYGQSLQNVPPAKFPARIESYLRSVVRPSASERNSLLAGAAITKFLDADPSKEIAVFGAIWIKARIARYVEALKDIEHFESGGSFKLTKRISSPPKLENFAELRLPDTDVRDLRNCQVGKCELKLSQLGIEKLRAAASVVRNNFRELAYAYATGYLEKGNQGLAVYRDAERPTFVANEFSSMIDRMPELIGYLPDVRHYLLEYPHATLSNSTEFLYWQEAQFGLKPTVRMSHLIIKDGPEETIVASKMLYASHYFWTALELRALVPDPSRGPGFWFVTVNRSRSDGLEGFLGRIIRGRVRGEVQKAVLASLILLKRKLNCWNNSYAFTSYQLTNSSTLSGAYRAENMNSIGAAF